MRRICLAVVLSVCLIGSASAQRTLVPLFDHIDIPVNSDHELTVAQVRKALRTAAAIEGWGSTVLRISAHRGRHFRLIVDGISA